MRKLKEGSSVSGTWKYKSKADAEAMAEVLELQGVHETSEEGGGEVLYSPGQDEDDLKKRVRRGIVIPDQAQYPATTRPAGLGLPTFAGWLQYKTDK